MQTITRPELVDAILRSELDPSERRDLIFAVRRIKVADVLADLKKQTGRQFARQSVYQTKAGARSQLIERTLARLLDVPLERLFPEHYAETATGPNAGRRQRVNP